MESEKQRRSIAEEKTRATPRKKRRQLSESDKKTLLIIGICTAAVLVLIGLLFGIYNMIINQTSLIPKNVCVAGVNVGGLTRQEATALVEKKVGTSYETTTMVVTILDRSVEISPSVSGVRLDVGKAVDAAIRFKRGNLTGTVDVDISACLSLDESAIREKLNSLAFQFNSGLSQSTYQVVGTCPPLDKPSQTQEGMTLVVTKGTPEYSINLDDLFSQVSLAYSRRDFAPTLECEKLEPEAIDWDAVFAQYCKLPVDAVMDEEKFEIIDETYGYGFSVTDAEILYEKAEYGEEIRIPFQYITPDVLKESFSEKLYADTLGSYSCKASINANMTAACEILNQVTMYPGDVFSFNSTVGPFTSANGYRKAPDCTEEEIMGGGVCVVASALYGSVLQSELSILEVNAHTYAQSYADVGMDAKIVWGAEDLRFVNNTNYPIKIEATASGGSVSVSLIGTEERDYKVQLQVKITKKLEYDVEYITMEPNNKDGYKDGDIITTPITGYKVDIFLRQIKNDGSSDTSVFDCTREYAVRNKQICSIVAPTEPPKPATPPEEPTTNSADPD